MKSECKTQKIRVLNPDTQGIPVFIVDDDDILMIEDHDVTTIADDEAEDITVVADLAQIEALARACAQ
jgi:hypothetical protein